MFWAHCVRDVSLLNLPQTRLRYEQAKSDRDNKVTDNAAPPRKEEKKKKDKEEKRKSSVKDVSSLGVPGSLSPRSRHARNRKGSNARIVDSVYEEGSPV